MPAEHLTMLSAAQARAGETSAANFTIQLAAQREWREPIAQETVLRNALATGDKAEAARRFTTLFRRNATSDELLTTLAPQVFDAQGGAGRQTFADELAGGTRGTNCSCSAARGSCRPLPLQRRSSYRWKAARSSSAHPSGKR